MTTNNPAPTPPTTCRSCRRNLKINPRWVVAPSACLVCLQCNNCGCVCTNCAPAAPALPHRCDSSRYWCNTCHTCSAHCTCRRMPRAMRDDRLKIIGKTTRVSPLPRAIGIELEIGDWKRLADHRFTKLRYTPAHDWSVKPSEQEMVLAPMYGDAVVAGMLELGEVVARTGAVINETCALHVHVAGSDLSYWEIRRLLLLYTAIEQDIYRYLVAKHRYASPEVVHYCQLLTGTHARCERCRRYETQYPGQRIDPEPVATTLARMNLAKTTTDLKACLLRMLYRIENPSNSIDSISTHKGGRYEFCRYFGLNLHSWMHRGTVEFRMKEGTADPEELVYWPLWCGWLVHACTRMSDAEATAATLRGVTAKFMPGYLAKWVEGKIEAAVAVLATPTPPTPAPAPTINPTTGGFQVQF